MKYFEIDDIKKFMEHLLIKESFDKFYLVGLELKTFTNFSVDGRKTPGWMDEQEGDYVLWKNIRPRVVSLIQGKREPEVLKIHMSFPLSPTVTGGLQIRFKEGELFCMSSLNNGEFTLDRGPEQDWDDYCEHFLEKNELNYRIC